MPSKIYCVPVLIEIETETREPSPHDAAYAVRIAVQTLVNDGLEDDEITIVDFQIEEAENAEKL